MNIPFRTPLHSVSAPFQLGLQTPVLTLGSCFAEVIGEQLTQYKVPTSANPFGTVFNPVSMARLLSLLLGDEELHEKQCVQVQNQWYHYDLHSRFTGRTARQVLESAQQTLQQTKDFLATTRCLILTLGTAWVYRLRTDQHIVSNCHKVPAQAFEKKILSLEEAVQPLQRVLSSLTHTYPEVRIILTVSPVRHLKDSLPLNSLSKSVLRVACHMLTEQFASATYFPAYEIMLDDLRDYRFYQADMIHPSEVAEEYIWELFTQTYFDAETRRFFREWGTLRQALAHRPFQPDSDAYQQFLENTEKKILSYQQRIDVSAELAYLHQLKNPGNF